MKKLLFILFLVFINAETNAQIPIFKKMRTAIENKVENKIMQKTDKSVDKVLEAPFNIPTATSKVSSDVLPTTYVFSWKYDVEVQSQNNKPMTMTYFLQPNSDYQGMLLGDIKSDMFMIMDFQKMIMINLFDAAGSKMGQIMNIPKEDLEATEGEIGDYITTSLPDRTISGYKCKGILLKNNEYLIKYYFTNDVPVTLNGMNRDKKDSKVAKVINGINSKDPGLMMRMELTDLKNKKNSMVMECKNLEEFSKMISKADYKFM